MLWGHTLLEIPFLPHGWHSPDNMRVEWYRRYVFIDTPGQIEVFTWSASGQIITETLASAFPTVSIPCCFQGVVAFCSIQLSSTPYI